MFIDKDKRIPMHRNTLFTLLIILFTTSCSKAGQDRLTGQEGWQVGQIGVREGLTNSRITDIEQDGDGLIWVATEGGLFHLTGDRCRHYDAQL